MGSCKSKSNKKIRIFINKTDMPEDLQKDAIEISAQALDKFKNEIEIAAHIKKEFDQRHTPRWHCIVGKNFGGFVSHESKQFIYFSIGVYSFLLFKSC